MIYRRIDDDFLDPLAFRPDSLLGVPGLMNAYRAGNVALANAVGTGVADDKAIYPFVPDMIRFYLGEEPILPNVPTYICAATGRPRPTCSTHLDELVVKAVNESGGYGMLMGRAADAGRARRVRRDASRPNPRNYIAQPMVALSGTRPSSTTTASTAATSTCGRTCSTGGDQRAIMPGGLTRVALGAGRWWSTPPRAAAAKDTWVLAAGLS